MYLNFKIKIKLVKTTPNENKKERFLLLNLLSHFEISLEWLYYFL